MKSPRGEWECPTVVQPLNDLFHFPDLGREWFCIVHCIMETVERCQPRAALGRNYGRDFPLRLSFPVLQDTCGVFQFAQSLDLESIPDMRGCVLTTLQ